MTVEVKLPHLGECIDSAEVVNVLVAAGEAVAENRPVVEVETDKAVIEVPCAQAGTVTEVKVKVGDTVAVGQVLCTLDTAEPEPASGGAEGAFAPPEAPAETGAPVPAQGCPQEPETPPAPPSVAAPAVPAAAPAAHVPAAPSVRRLAREIGVDIAQVTGTGPGGRIGADDVKAFARRRSAALQAFVAPPGLASPPAAGYPLPDLGTWGPIERRPASRTRRLTAQRLQAVWQTTPMATQFDKADITELESWRKQGAARCEQAGGRLTITVILLKVVGAALQAYPQFNTSFDAASGEIIQKRYVHIGVAVDTPHGLLVPVVRDVDQKSIVRLSVELAALAAKARERKVSLADLQGGCMTITNLGPIGGVGFTPVLNPPEVAILGVARSAVEPVFVDGEFRPRLLLPLALTFDHRVIDGADGARFLRWIAAALTNPLNLLLEG